MSEYLDFVEESFAGKTKKWGVYSKRHGDKLGEVGWYGAWRQYTFRPSSQSIWNAQCLDDVQNFLEEANRAHRAARKAVSP